MKPVTYERDGVRVAVAVQVINQGGCSGAHGRDPGRSSELAAAGLDWLEFAVRAVGFLLRALLTTAVYLIGFAFALCFWVLGRVGEGLQAMESGMGGSRRNLVQGMLPPVFRSPVTYPELERETAQPWELPRGHACTTTTTHRQLLTTGDDNVQ